MGSLPPALMKLAPEIRAYLITGQSNAAACKSCTDTNIKYNLTLYEALNKIFTKIRPESAVLGMYTWIETKSLRRKLDKDVYMTGRHCIIFAKYVGKKWILDPQRGIYGTFSRSNPFVRVKPELTNHRWLEKQNTLPGGRRLININILTSVPGLIYSNGRFFTRDAWDFFKAPVTSKELSDLGYLPRPASGPAVTAANRRRILKQLDAARADLAAERASRKKYRFSSSSHKSRRKKKSRRKSSRRCRKSSRRRRRSSRHRGKPRKSSRRRRRSSRHRGKPRKSSRRRRRSSRRRKKRVVRRKKS